jgi:tetratricopeptide (TPR) repeat protein
MGKKLYFGVLLCLFLLPACAGRVPQPLPPAGRSFDATLNQGLELMSQKEYERAAVQLQAAVAARPDSSRAHNYLGLCYFHLKSYGQAREEFNKAVSLDAAFAAAHNNLAGVYLVKAQYAQAEEEYKKALSLVPDILSSNYSLGILLTNLGRADEGAVYLSRGIALDPDYLEKNKDTILTFSSQSFNPKETYFACARAYAAAGNVERTVDYLNKARDAGFMEWQRILTEKEFERVRQDQRIKEFLKSED